MPILDILLVAILTKVFLALIATLHCNTFATFTTLAPTASTDCPFVACQRASVRERCKVVFLIRKVRINCLDEEAFGRPGHIITIFRTV